MNAGGSHAVTLWEGHGTGIWPVHMCAEDREGPEKSSLGRKQGAPRGASSEGACWGILEPARGLRAGSSRGEERQATVGLSPK